MLLSKVSVVSVFAIATIALVLVACGGGGGGTAMTPAGGIVPPAASGSPIPSSFFAMTIPAGGSDYPPASVNTGALGHPSTLAWAFIEPSKGQYDFSGFDRYVNDAQAHGLIDANGAVLVTITFGNTPMWAAADPSTCGQFGCTSPPANIQDWKDFITTVVGHYNGVIEPHVKYYELWNEASAPNFWSGSIGDLVNLAAAAYPIVHTDPYSQLLTPSVSGPVTGSSPQNAVNWMTSYLQAGGAQYADGGTFHGYIARSTTPPLTPYPMPEQDSTSGCSAGSDCYGSIVTKETAMRAVFDQNGMRGKPMLDTEGSWGVTNNVTDSDTQTAWLARWYILQASYYPNITQASWYTWGTGGLSQWGWIENSTGVPTVAGIAYGVIVNWLVGATFATPCSADRSGTWTCALTRPGGYQGLIVWNVNGNLSYTPAARYKEYRDLGGNTTPLTGPVTIGAKPLLLQN